MLKTILLMVLAVRLGIAGFGIYSVASSDNFIENYSPGHPASSEMSLDEFHIGRRKPQ